MDNSFDEIVPKTESSADALATSPSRKRERDAADVDEIEVDINAPEPPSKRAKRRAKKGKPFNSKGSANIKASFYHEESAVEPLSSPSPSPSDFEDPISHDTTSTSRKTGYGVWIGNLPFTCTPASLCSFLTNVSSSITDTSITRVHMPVPTPGATKSVVKSHNKGFAYVDFATTELRTAAIALSETEMGGRKLLIKSAEDFQGRPEKSAITNGDESKTSKTTKVAEGGTGHPPTQRVFVGNLGYDMTADDLRHNFAPCGEILDVHCATFEDSGRSKGYAWVRFGTIEAAEAAVRGWCKIITEKNDAVEAVNGEQGERKREKKQKWFVNRIHGRQIRCEFAEDPAVRYKRRFGKSTKDARGGNGENGDFSNRGSFHPYESQDEHRQDIDGSFDSRNIHRDSESKAARRKTKAEPFGNRKKLDPRTVRPGASLARAQRGKTGIVPGQGTKIRFD